MNQKHEMSLVQSRGGKDVLYVIGCDEAGRGPLAGPVATAATCFLLSWDKNGALPNSIVALLDDSKAMTEANRETVVKQLLQSAEASERLATFSKTEQSTPFTFVCSSNEVVAEGEGGQEAPTTGLSVLLGGAVLFMPAATIDERNILEASMDGMCMCAAATLEAVNAHVLHPNGLPVMTAANTVVFIDGPHTPWGLMTEAQRAKKIATQLTALKAKLRKEAKDAECKKAPASPAKKGAKRKKANAEDDEVLKKLLPQYQRGPISGIQGVPCIPVVKGDALCPSIAAASVLAKVSRDDFLTHTMHPRFPQYEFSSHKGYPTKAHMELLRKHGACEFHRRSFGPVQAALGLGSIVNEPTADTVASVADVDA